MKILLLGQNQILVKTILIKEFNQWIQIRILNKILEILTNSTSKFKKEQKVQPIYNIIVKINKDLDFYIKSKNQKKN
jgi:hypothetical protein